MSSLLLFADNASSVLASGIDNVQTTLTVAATTGSKFSNPGATQYALGTLQDIGGNIEIVKITSRIGDTFVVVRAQEGTTAIAFASGTRFEQRVTAGMLAAFLQKTGSDTLSGTTVLSGVLQLGSGGSIQGGEVAGAAIRSQPGDTSNQISVPVGNPATAAGSVILTASNIVSKLGSGLSLIQSGMIILWSGTSASVPGGFNVCDGSNGTPDLRDLFVLGAGGALPPSGGGVTTSTDGAHTHTGFTGTYVLTNADMPAGGGATLPFTFINIGQASGGTGTGNVLVTGNTAHATLPFVGAASNAHRHTISSDGAHDHSCLPPYQALFYIMKL